MKTDPPPAPDPARPQPLRPRGKVFDVMRPGKAPASPSSRPVVIAGKLEAQKAQRQVSGIGAPDLPAPPPSHHAVAKQAQSIVVGDASGVPAGSSAPDVPETPIVPIHETAASTPDSPADEKTEPSAEPDTAASTPDPLAAVAVEPDPPAPAPVEPERPKLPIPEVPDDDPVHDAATPSLNGQVVVSHHSTAPSGTGKLVLLVVLVVFFVILVLDILMDVGIISTSVIPHTHLF